MEHHLDFKQAPYIILKCNEVIKQKIPVFLSSQILTIHTSKHQYKK